MDIKDKALKLYEDLKKPSVALALKYVAPVVWKGIKSLINKWKGRSEAEEVSTPPTPPLEGAVPPETVATEAPKIVLETPAVPAIAAPVEKAREVTWYPTPNYSSRRGTKVTAVILHHTGPGGSKAALSWLTSKESGVSAHYVIDRDGKIYQLVKEEDKAWHCGVSALKGVKDCNTFSIGIEIVGNGTEEFTQEQYDSIAFVCKTAKTKYSIDNSMIVGHKDIALPLGRKTDPSPFNWDKLFALI